jgi:hypothetical protein
MSSRELEDRHDADLDAYVADQLGMTEDIADYPYTLDEKTTGDGVVTGWLIKFDDQSPPSAALELFGDPPGQWCIIPVKHEAENPEFDRY